MVFKNAISLAACLCVLLLLASPVQADVLLLKDGRIVKGKPMVLCRGGVKIRYPSGEVFVPKRMIQHVARSGPDGVLEAEDKRLVRESEYRRTWRYRNKAESDHFAFEYTVPDRIARDTMDLFEAFRAHFDREWGLEVVENPKKLKVCFYHDAAYFRQVSGGEEGATCYFRFVEPIELNFYSNRNDRQETVEAALWAETHYMLHLLQPGFRWPEWLGQGLADFYSCMRWNSETRTFETGRLHPIRMAKLQDELAEDKRIGLDVMIRKRLKPKTRSPHPSPWPWSFCHFMLQSPKYATKFKSFILALARDPMIQREPDKFAGLQVEPEVVVKILREHLGLEDLEALEKEWHEHARTLEGRSPRFHVHAAWLAMRKGAPLTTLKHLENAVRAGGKSQRLFYLYGKTLYTKDKNEKAVEMLKKAIEIDPLDAWSYMYAGRAYHDMGGHRETSERYQRLALEIDPEDEDLRDLATLKKR